MHYVRSVIQRPVERILRLSAWATLGFVILLGVFSLLVPRSSAGSGPPPGMVVALVAFAVSAMFLWVTATWHAVTDTSHRPVQRAIWGTLMLVGSFPAGLVYYFGYLHWALKARASRAASPDAV